MITYKDKEKFIKDGYIECTNLFNRRKCKNTSNKLKKAFNLKKIFLSKNEFLNQNKKQHKKNFVNKLDLDFLIKNKKFKNILEAILGRNYYLYASRVICGVPLHYLPEWIKEKMILNSPNLNPFIKEKYKSIRYFNGIDYHMDLIDFKNEPSDFVTVYVYLDKVTKKMSPLNLLTGSHFGGSQIFPHKILKKKNHYVYYSGKKKITSKKKILLGKSGDAWIWHGCLLHGSEFNLSKHPRYSLRFIFRKKKEMTNKGIIMNELNSRIRNITAKSNMSNYKKYKKFYNLKSESTRKKLLIKN